MKLTEYAWSNSERQLKAYNLEKIPSPYKVKIVDDFAKHTQLEKALTQLSQVDLAKRAILNVEIFIQDIDINISLKKAEIITTAKAVLLKWIDVQASAYELRQADLLANNLAKDSVSETSKFAPRIFAQAIATGHMHGHAIVSTDYEIKVVNIKHPNDMDAVIA